MNNISVSQEDYLEAIVMLGGTTEVAVRSVDVATRLDVSKASVNKAVAALKKLDMLDQPSYGGITLTKKGYECGRSILLRHKMLTRFLNEVIGIDKERAEEEACLMEHAISDDSFEKWMAYLTSLGLK